MIPDSILPPVRPRKDYADVSPDSLVYALYLNPAQIPDPVDNSLPEPTSTASDIMQQKIDRLRPRKKNMSN